MHCDMHFPFILISLLLMYFLTTSDAIPCDSCGNECYSACGTKHFRTCCFNYLRKRSDPKALKLISNKRLIDFILLQGRALITENELSRIEKDQRKLNSASRKNGTIIDLDLQTYYG